MGRLQCLVDWREISMKQSVGKCKQINFLNLCVNIHTFKQCYWLNQEIISLVFRKEPFENDG